MILDEGKSRIMRINNQHGQILRHWQVWTAVVVIACAGCGGDARPTTVPVHGKVTYQGEPVTQGTVTFQPVKPAEGYPKRPATGTIGADGTYELSTFEAGDGAIPGEYQVAVVSKTGEATLEQPDAPETWLVPEKYASAEQSGLTATVPPDASSPVEINLELTD